MWNPGFPYEAAEPAELSGFHRAFCVYSVFYRGTPERPGLVLGLDRGGVCSGMAYRVAPRDAMETLTYLRAREQITGAYRETIVPVELKGGSHRTVQALTFVTERHHPAYAHGLGLDAQARLIRAARGQAGANIDYALNTICHLQRMACVEPNLARLVPVLGALFRANRAATLEGGDAVRPHAGDVLAQHLARHPSRAPRCRPDQRKRYMYRDHLAASFDTEWQKTR